MVKVGVLMWHGRSCPRNLTRTQNPSLPHVQYINDQKTARRDQPFQLPSFCTIRAFTIFFTSEAGKGVSKGKCSVPFETRNSLSSSLNASSTDEPSGKKLQ